MIPSKIIDREVSTVIMIILIGNQFRMRRDAFETLRSYSVWGSFWSCENQSGRYCDWKSNSCCHGLFYSQIDPGTRKRFVFQHLFAAIKDKYPLKIDWEGAKYVGIDLEWNYTKREVILSMKGYVERALKQFKHLQSTKHHYGPTKYKPPEYG